jgi:hypothetical protein
LFHSKVVNLFSPRDLLVRLVPQVRQDPIPVGEAFTAGQTHWHFTVRNLPVLNRMIGSQDRILDETAGALIALLTANAYSK